MLGATVSDLLDQALPEGTTEALHGRRMALVRREACAVAAQKLKLDQLLVVGRGYEGQVPTMHMLAGEAEALQGTVAGDAGSASWRRLQQQAQTSPLACHFTDDVPAVCRGV